MLGDILGGLGSLVGAGMNWYGANQANKMSKSIAREQMKFQQNMAREAMTFGQASAQHQMDWQERMSNTSYQRMIQDLKSAGMNPILAMNAGGASTPGGSSASGQSAGGASFQAQNELANAVSSAVDYRRAQAEVKNMSAQNRNLLAQNKLIDAQSAEAAARTAKTLAEIDYVRHGRRGQDFNFVKDNLPSFANINNFTKRTTGQSLKDVPANFNRGVKKIGGHMSSGFDLLKKYLKFVGERDD